MSSKSITQDPIGSLLLHNLPTLAASITSVAVGIVLLMDDAADYGQVDRLHHWQYGIPFLLGGLAGLGYAVANIIGSMAKTDALKKINANPQKKQRPYNMKAYAPELIASMK